MKKSKLTVKTSPPKDKDVGVSDTRLIQATVNNFPAHAPDDGPLTAKKLAALRKDAAKNLPRGKVISRNGLA